VGIAEWSLLSEWVTRKNRWTGICRVVILLECNSGVGTSEWILLSEWVTGKIKQMEGC